MTTCVNTYWSMKKDGPVMNVEIGWTLGQRRTKITVLPWLVRRGCQHLLSVMLRHGERVMASMFTSHRHISMSSSMIKQIPRPHVAKKQGETCDAKCEWLENPYFDTYVINPSS